MPLTAARHPPAAPSPPRSLTAAVRAVQIAYPQIYLACNTRLTRARSSAFHLSARDSSADRTRAVDGLTLLGRAARGLGGRAAARSQVRR
jgi:hypothetical protein